MKEVVLKEIKKGLNWKDRIIVKLFPKTFIKVYNCGEQYVDNMINQLCEKYSLREEFVRFLIKMIYEETHEDKIEKIEEYINLLF